MKSTILISKQWHQPEITIGVSEDTLTIQMPIADYLSALVEEMGSPAFVVTKAGLLAKIQAASDVVVRAMKAETARVM